MDFERVEIDARFRNSENGRLFTECLVCRKELIESESEYFIERIFRRVPDLGIHETLFEYAMCATCAMDLRKEMSAKSLKNIEDYFNAKIRGEGAESAIGDTGHCLLTGKDIGDSMEYSLHAHCIGDHMLTSIFPYAISDDAMDEISALLSDETNDLLDDFKGRHFTGPPELMELLNPRRFVPL